MQGIFIDFEGIDGSGKGSLIRLLIEKLAALGIEPVMGKEPGGTPLGSKIRELLFKDPTTHAMAPSVCDCLSLADHIQHGEKLIKPALAPGRVIISDRYAYTEFAYACDREVHSLIDQAYHELTGPVPDIIFLLGGTPENLLERAQGRTEETHQVGKKWNNADSQRRIQDTYLRLLSLDQLNERLWHWLDTVYHRREHSSLQSTPLLRWQRDIEQVRQLPPATDMRRLFIHRMDRLVRKDSTFLLKNRFFEAPSHLAGKRIEARFDPLDLTQLEIYSDGKPEI